MKRILFDVPRWHVYQHRSARQMKLAEQDDSPRLRFEDELFDRLFSGEVEALPEEKKSIELRSWAEKVHSACDQLPAFQRLTDECMGDADAAASAVEEVMGQLGPDLAHEPDQVSAPALRRALGAGCEKASNAVEQQREAQEALAGVTWGSGPGSPGKGPGPGARALAVRLKKDRRLARIAELAGRFKRIALAKQRSKVKHGSDEISDVELGADLGRLLPSELTRLLKPVQRLALLRDLGERRCMQYRLSGTEPLGKGPLVVLLDKSGSMDGDKDVWATAVSLALLEVAQRQRRTFALLAFESLVRDEQVVTPGGALREQALFTATGGGTEIGLALRRGLEFISEHPGVLKKADVVLVTDGMSETFAAEKLREQARSMGVTILGVGINVASDALAAWADQAVSVDRLDTVDDKTAERIFTV